MVRREIGEKFQTRKLITSNLPNVRRLPSDTTRSDSIGIIDSWSRSPSALLSPGRPGYLPYCLSADRAATKESSISPAQTHPSISRSVEFEIGSAGAYSPFVH